MTQDNKTVLDLDKIFHYKNLSDQNRKIIIVICTLIFFVGVVSFVSRYSFIRHAHPRL